MMRSGGAGEMQWGRYDVMLGMADLAGQLTVTHVTRACRAALKLTFYCF